MTTRTIVNGAFGRMGTTTVNAINSAESLELVASLGRDDNLAETIKSTNAEVVIDFTNTESVYQNSKTILTQGAHAVIGSSGLLSEQIDELRQLAEKNNKGCIIAPNFSLGAVLIMKYAAEIAGYLPDVEIIEMHRKGKQDSPSGTAIRSAELIAEKRQQIKPITKSREIIPGARGANHEDIAIHAVRLPGIVAQQSIIFGGLGETLTINHTSINRECFMPGVLLACNKVVTTNGLIYGLENLI